VKIQERNYGAVTVLKPDGPLADEEVGPFKNRLLEVMRKTLGRAVLDVSAVPFVDSEALEALVDVSNEMAQGGQALKLCAASRTLREVLELTGLSSQFEHFEDTNSAVRSFL